YSGLGVCNTPASIQPLLAGGAAPNQLAGSALAQNPRPGRSNRLAHTAGVLADCTDLPAAILVPADWRPAGCAKPAAGSAGCAPDHAQVGIQSYFVGDPDTGDIVVGEPHGAHHAGAAHLDSTLA